MKTFAVIGLGRYGRRVATKLYELGEDVLAVDINEELVEDIADNVTRAAVADADNKKVLKSLGVHECDCAIVAIGTNLEASILVTMNLKSIGVPYVVCKAHDETHQQILEKIGADRVIIPEHATADKLCMSLSAPDVLEMIDLSDEFGIMELIAPKTWVGRSLMELKIRAKYGVNMIAVKNGRNLQVSLAAEDRIQENAVLVLLGEYSALEKIKDIK